MSAVKAVKKSAVLSAALAAAAVIVAVLIAYTLYTRSRPASGPSGGPGQAARTVTAVRVGEVVHGTIENSVVVNGDVLAGNQIAIYPTVAGKLVETRLGVGDRVDAGTVVALVDPSRPGESYSLSPVVSTISGTVLQAPYGRGDTLTTASAVYVVGDLSVLEIETFIPERYASAVRLGLPAVVSFEALPGETFTAAVSEVSPVLDPASRTLRIRLRFSGPADRRVKAGMFATLSLVINTRANVPVIRRDAVINTYGTWIVFVIRDDNTAERREISIGLESEDAVEVLEGLAAGDRVVIEGQNFLSEDDPVRIVD
jgi:multidrug efflux pump subunit AcrA (membrane-fusion protein)